MGQATSELSKVCTIRPGRAPLQLDVLPDSTKEAVTLGIEITDSGTPRASPTCLAHHVFPLAGGPASSSGAMRSDDLARRAIAIAPRTTSVASARCGALSRRARRRRSWAAE